MVPRAAEVNGHSRRRASRPALGNGARRPHIREMKTHPHAESSYRVIPTANGAFAVEVTIPDSHPATVSSFATEQAAEAWIARTRQRVAAEGQAGRWFQRPARDNRADRARR